MLDYFSPIWPFLKHFLAPLDKFGPFGPVWTSLDHVGPFWPILDHVRPFWPFFTILTIFDHFGPFWPIFTILTIFHNCWPFGIILDHFSPFWTILDHLDHFDHFRRLPFLTFSEKFLIQNFFLSFWNQRIYDTTLGSRDIATWHFLWCRS